MLGCTRCVIPAQECMNSDIFNSALELPTGIYTIHSHVEQHVEHARKFYSQQFILKKVIRHLIIMSSWVTGCQVSFGVSCWFHFVTWTIWYQYPYMKNYKDVNTYQQVCCPWKVLIQNGRARWFTMQTLYSAFVQAIVRVGYSSSLLLLWTLANI